MNAPLISVVVATRHRPDDLADTLASLEEQALSPSRYEVIVIDNGLSNDTKDVALRPRRLRSLIYMPEPVPGLSRARNTGIKASHGEIIAFMDDDAVAAPNWLVELENAYRDPAIQCVGGRVEGKWLCPRPRWFPLNLDSMLSTLDLGDHPVKISPPFNSPSVSNISFRRDVFDRYGLFNTALGRGGHLFSGGEEVELFCKLSRGGGQSIYWPRAVVQHKISADRLSPGRLFGIAFDSGRLAARLRHKEDAPIEKRATMRSQKAPLPATLFRAAIKTAMACGYAWQSFCSLLPEEQPDRQAIPVE